MSDPAINALQPYYVLVEEVIASLGVGADQCRVKDQSGNVVAGHWNLRKGSANIYVDVYATKDGYGYCCVASPIMEIKTDKLKEFYEKLLNINHQMYAVSFSINQGWVWLRALRECKGMDADELKAMFDRVGWYADHYDDELKGEFGG
jgi:hypothetical protein